MTSARPKSAFDKPWSYFSDDVVMEVLLKLPVRSLLRLRSVSKHWLALIQSRNFVNLHLNRPINNHANNSPILTVHSNRRKSVLSLLTSDDNEETLAYKDDATLESLSPRIHSRGLWFNKGRILGPCNGLFCLTDMVDMLIFNPATKQRREVLSFPPSSTTNFVRYRHGISDPCFDRVCFGFDSVCRDYKVVGFRLIDCDDKSDCDYNRVEIYSLSTNTWTHVNLVVPARDTPWFRNRNCDLFFNGAFHWLGCRSRVICSIVVFDLNKEAFKQLELPDSFPIRNYFPVYLSVLDECLRIVVLGMLHPDIETEIWVMKEYGVYKSWTKLYNIRVDIYIREPLSCSKDGEFILKVSDRRLVSLNLNSGKIKGLEVAIPRGFPAFAFRYKESLVTL